MYRGADGVIYGSRKISVAQGSVGQYQYNAFGLAVGSPDVQHLVTLTALTVKGSAVIKTLGQEFFEARYVTPNLTQEMTAKVNEAFAPLVKQGFIRIDSIVVEPNNGAPTVTRVKIHDLTRDLPLDEVTITNG